MCIIMEYASRGCLQDMLRRQRQAFEMNNLSMTDSHVTSHRDPNLTIGDLIAFMHQISKGMQYISSIEVGG